MSTPAVRVLGLFLLGALGLAAAPPGVLGIPTPDVRQDPEAQDQAPQLRASTLHLVLRRMRGKTCYAAFPPSGLVYIDVVSSKVPAAALFGENWGPWKLEWVGDDYLFLKDEAGQVRLVPLNLVQVWGRGG